ncbi:hypothetical protein O9929_05925 [Vibrio lentus]|nr:hypothetical protein [Vibrio lentus]
MYWLHAWVTSCSPSSRRSRWSLCWYRERRTCSPRHHRLWNENMQNPDRSELFRVAEELFCRV